MKYTFGTSTIAADRLRNVARVFNPASAEFARKYGRPVRQAVDLGCGPGFTTDMLAKIVKCDSMYGIDNSDGFLDAARSTFPHCTFIRHNVMESPFPVMPELMYGRFLLSHLVNVHDVVNMWIDELAPGGMLLIDEMEDVETDSELFSRYLAVNRGLVASQGATLYVGATLAAGTYAGKVLANEIVRVPIRNRDAASMFYPNTISIWENEDYVRSALPAAERKEISDRLKAMLADDSNVTNITWVMRHMVIVRNT